MATALTRTLILYLLIIVGLRLMGKRQIGELEPGELVLTMMLSDLAAVPMQDFGIPLLAGVLPILAILSLSMLLSQLSLHNLRFRALVCGTPSVIIDRGRICQDAMRRNRFTVDELLEELRLQGHSDPAEIKYAVLENSGQLSILPWTASTPPTAEQLGIEIADAASLPRILINDGRTLHKELTASGKNDTWLLNQLHARDIDSPRQVFLFTVAEDDAILCIRKEDA